MQSNGIAHYRKHALDRKTLKFKKSFPTFVKTNSIPILISKSRNDYKLLSEKIIKILKK